jgi:hypothetical protein
VSRLRNHIGCGETERPQSINFPPCSAYLHRAGNKNQAGKETPVGRQFGCLAYSHRPGTKILAILHLKEKVLISFNSQSILERIPLNGQLSIQKTSMGYCHNKHT